MKDKEMIEEMKNNARIYIGAVVEKLRMDGCELWEIDGIVENILNYITVPKDSVVLTREEYQTDFSNQFNKGYKHGSKETAEKIYSFAVDFSDGSEQWQLFLHNLKEEFGIKD